MDVVLGPNVFCLLLLGVWLGCLFALFTLLLVFLPQFLPPSLLPALLPFCHFLLLDLGGPVDPLNFSLVVIVLGLLGFKL